MTLGEVVMCRLLSMVGKLDESVKRTWIDAWRRSSSFDPLLYEIRPELDRADCRHADGWGMVAISVDSTIRDMTSFRSSNSVDSFDLSSLMNQNALRSNDELARERYELLLFHSRRASPNTPKTFFQTHPFQMVVPYQSLLMYLAHNGTVDKTVINKLLPESARLSPERLSKYSDTEMLSWLIQVNASLATEQRNGGLFWRDFFRIIIESHQEVSASYVLQIHLLECQPSELRLIVLSAMSEDNLFKKKYYQQYQVSSAHFQVYCSSTVMQCIYESSSEAKEIAAIPLDNNVLVEWSSSHQDSKILTMENF